MAEKRCGFSRQAHAPKVVGSNPTSARYSFLMGLGLLSSLSGKRSELSGKQR